MQVCTSLQTDNHANTPPLSFFTGRMPFLLPKQQRQSTEGIFNRQTTAISRAGFQTLDAILSPNQHQSIVIIYLIPRIHNGVIQGSVL